MRNQDREVYRAPHTLALKMSNACPQHHVIVEVRDQEERGGDERRNHHPLVRLAASRLNEVIARADQHGAGAVEKRVEGREEGGGDLHGLHSRPMYPDADECNGHAGAVCEAQDPQPPFAKSHLESPLTTAASIAVVVSTAITNVAAQVPGLEAFKDPMLKIS